VSAPAPCRTYLELDARIEDVGVSGLFYKLFANGWSGTLTLGEGASERSIYIEHGVPVFAESAVIPDELAETLIKADLLGFVEVTSLMSTASGGRLHQWATTQASVDAERLQDVLALMVRETYLSTFAIESGPYVFGYGEGWFRQDQRFPQNPVELISTGLRRYSNLEDLASRVEGKEAQFVVRTEKFEDFRVHLATSDREAHWLAWMDGTQTLGALATRANLDATNLKSFVTVLEAADMIDFLDTPRKEAARSPHKRPLPDVEARPSSGYDYARRELPPEAPEPAPTATQRTQITRADVLAAVADYEKLLGDEVAYNQLLGVRRGAHPRILRKALRDALGKMPKAMLVRLSRADHDRAVRVRMALRNAFNVLMDPAMARRPTRKVRLVTKHRDSGQQPTVREPRARSGSAEVVAVPTLAPRKTGNPGVAKPGGARRAAKLYLAGCEEEERGNLINAVAYFRRALSVDPNHSAARSRLAHIQGSDD